MTVIAGMVGRQCPLELDMCGMRKEEVFGILRAHNHARTLSRYLPSAGYTGWVTFLVMAVGTQSLGFSCTAACSHCRDLAAGARRAFEEVMLKMILPFSRDLQDVS